MWSVAQQNTKCEKIKPSALYSEVYKTWLGAELSECLSESLISCHDCAMVNPKGFTRDKGPFDPELKCCTYYPYIPNFSIGAMISNSKGAGEFFLSKVSDGTLSPDGVLLPLGLFPSKSRAQSQEKLKENGFGVSRNLLCPFYDTQTQGCGIWAYRSGVCSSYFCQSKYGEAGFTFWKEVERYISLFEWSLAHEVLWQMGFTLDDVRLGELARDSDCDEKMRRSWSEYYENKLEFYVESYRRACELGPQDIAKLLGEEGLSLQASLKHQIKGLTGL